jgi:copper transport protein
MRDAGRRRSGSTVSNLLSLSPRGRGPGGGVPRIPTLIVVLLLVVWALNPQTVNAHASLLRSDPAAGVSLATGPDSVTLWFSESIEPGYSRVQILRSDGSRISAGDLQLIQDGPDPALLLPLPDELPRGSYTVVWSVLSAVDGHVTEGFFSFTVGDALLPSATAELELAQQAAGQTGVPRAVQGGVRWLGLLGQATIAGALIFLLAVQPVVRVPGGSGVPARRFRWLFLAALAALAAGHLGAAVVQTMNATRLGAGAALGEPLIDLLGSTRYGALWLSRSALLVALGLIAWTLTRRERLVMPRGQGRLLWAAALLVSALVLLTTSLGSHAAARSGTVSWQVANDWLHLVGTAVWVGGLVALLVTLPGLASAGRHALLPVLARFSVLAGASVALLALTGILAARQSVGGWDGLTTTDYGTWLILKLVIVAATIGLAAYHLLLIRPALEAGAPAADRLRHSLRLETSLVLAVLAVTAMLTVSVPGRDLLGGTQGQFATTRLTAEMSLTLRVTPGQIGTNEFAIDIGPVEPETFGELQRVYLRFTPAGADGHAAGSQRVQLRQSGPGDSFTFRGAGAYIALEGRWEVAAIVRRAGVRDVEVPFALTASREGIRPADAPWASTGRTRAAEKISMLGGLWILAALALGAGGWWLRRSGQAIAWGLYTMAGLTLVFGAILLVIGGPGAS